MSYTTYLGQKGYTLLKTEIPIEMQKKIQKDLLIQPYVHGQPKNSMQTTFPAYRESSNKLYVPHHYGVSQFGSPKEIKIPDGDDIHLPFNGKLRDYQRPVVEKFINHATSKEVGGGLLELPCAWGKCLGKDTNILMYDGTIQKVQDIKVGDVIMGDDSTPRNILSLARGREQMYKVINNIGDYYICNESHILSLYWNLDTTGSLLKGNIIDIELKHYFHLPANFHANNMLSGYKVPIRFYHKNIDIPPYSFGVWLYAGIWVHENSDSAMNAECITKYNLFKNKHIPHDYLCNDNRNRLELLAGIIDTIGNIHKLHIELEQLNKQLAHDVVFLARTLGIMCYTKLYSVTPHYNATIIMYGEALQNIPVRHSFPADFVRLQKKNALLSPIRIEKLGIDDYYGFMIDGNRRFVLGDLTVTHNTSASLYICSALRKKTLVIVHKEFLMNQWIERIQQFLPTARIGKIQGKTIDMENKDIVLCMLQSLSMKDYPSNTFDSFGLTIIDEVHHISSQTFSCALFKIVTKYMLGLSATMNRKDGTTKVFKMFLGDVVHKVERKDDASVLVKTIEYKTNDYEFNETITDYKGNPQISSMISKLCAYTRRTEFIIKVLCDFIQVDDIDDETVSNHKKIMDECNPSCRICLKSNNYLVINTCCNEVLYCMPCLNAIELDAESCITTVTNEEGKKRTTKKRAKCPHCNKVLKYEQNYIENPYVKPMTDRQTIILSHNLNILEYIYKKIVCKNYASVGYYVGGMKEVDLKISEKKQVILATFSMAAEALDIPSLNAEFLITPKTDIEQSVGRILRAKHATTTPVIFDIMDSHDVFKKQYLKRKKFYKKQNYKIIETNSNDYKKDESGWNMVYDPCITKQNNPSDESDEENVPKTCMIDISGL